jgi:mannose-6-phosphate isomerase-like protein (cupin superfamily)
MAKGKMFKVDHNLPYVENPPKHTLTHSFPLISPKTCEGAQYEFHITEIRPGGTAEDDIHPNEDHAFFCLSGRAKAKVGDDEFLMEPGCALWVPKNTVHNFKVLGGETFRIAVVFAPPRKL